MAAPALAGTLPAGFTETTVWSGLGNPTVIRFAPDGRVFVASKSGIVNVFDNLGDTTPTQFVDLRSKVHDYWDRGLLGHGARPRLHHRAPVRLRPLRLRQGAELDPAAALGRQVPDPARPDRRRLRDHRPRSRGSTRPAPRPC